MLPDKLRRYPHRYFQDSKVWSVRKFIAPIIAKLDENQRLSILFEGPGYFTNTDNPLIAAFKKWQLKEVRNRVAAHNTPKVSVIIPVYNGEKFIAKSIASICTQSHENLEVIIVDDGSTDDTMAIVEKHAQNDGRVKLINNSRNMGVAYSRNIGLNSASGDYVTFQDADDVSAPDRVLMQLSALLESDRIKISFCNYVRIDSAGNRLEINCEILRKCIVSMMFPRLDIIKNIGYFRDLAIGEDSDFYKRIQIFYGKNCEALVFKTLYHAMFRVDSLLTSNSQNMTVDGTKITYLRSDGAEQKWQNLLSDYEEMQKNKASVYSPFQPVDEPD